MPVHKEWTAKRLDNVVRVRQYVTHTTYEEDVEVINSVQMTQEFMLTTRELGEFMFNHNIEEFGTEDCMEMQANAFA